MPTVKPTIKVVGKPTAAAPVKAKEEVKAKVAPAAPAAPATPKKTKEEITAALNASREARHANAEVDELLGMKRLNTKSFRWVCKDALVSCWPKSGKVEDFNMDDCVETCKTLFAERGGVKEITDEEWVKNINTIRKWLASPAIGKMLPGDNINVPKEQDPEKLAAMRERLAKGRATAAANRAASKNIDETDAATVTDA